MSYLSPFLSLSVCKFIDSRNCLQLLLTFPLYPREFALTVSDRETFYVFRRLHSLPLSVDKSSLKWRTQWRKENKGSENFGSVSCLNSLNSPESKPDPSTFSTHRDWHQPQAWEHSLLHSQGQHGWQSLLLTTTITTPWDNGALLF